MWWLALVSVVSATPSAGVRLEIEHEGALVLGETTAVALRIVAQDTEDSQDRPLRASVNVGRLEAIERVSAGVYRSTYLLPETRHPQVAFLAVWRETGPEAPVTFLRIPLSGKTTLPVGTKAGAEVEVSFGKSSFGPFIANAQGQTQIPLEVPPGVTSVLVRSKTTKQEFQKTVPVAVPPYNRMTLAVTPYRIEADGESFAIAHVFYDVTPPPPIARIRVSADGGTVTPLDHQEGRYRFRFQPDRGIVSKAVVLKARAQGDRTSQAKIELSLGPPVPQRVSAQFLTDTLVADGTSMTQIRFLVTDRRGLGVPRLKLNITADTGTIQTAQDLGQGIYIAKVQAPQNYPSSGTMTVVATVPKTTLTTRTTLLLKPPAWPTSGTISLDPSVPIADGRSPCFVEFVAQDAAGRPFTAGGLHLTIKDGPTVPLEPAGHGRYRAQFVPQVDLETIQLSIAHDSERFSMTEDRPARPPPKLLFVGAAAGGLYRQALSASLIAETGVVLPWFDQRGRGALRLHFAQTELDFETPSLLIESRLRTLGLTVMGLYDIMLSTHWRWYAGLGGGPVVFDHQTVIENIAEIRSDVGATGDLIVGFSWFGGFIEMQASATALSMERFRGPRWGLGLQAGYRIEWLGHHWLTGE